MNKKTLQILFLLSFLLTFTSCWNHKQEVPTDENTEVMICTGRSSRRFHCGMCRGLKSCRGEILYVTLEQAKNMRKTPCGYCYKKSKPHDLDESDPHYYDDWDE